MASWKQGKMLVENANEIGYIGKAKEITYRSSWERIAWLKLIDLFKLKKIKGWMAEETIVKYTSKVDGKVHRYFIDLTVEYHDGRMFLIEIKPSNQTRPPKKTKNNKSYENQLKTWITNASKWTATKEYCDEMSRRTGVKHEFLIWTEKELGIKN